MTLEELAKAYAETIFGPENGHGQNVHPTLGRSDYIMRRMWEEFGRDSANLAIGNAMKEYLSEHPEAS